MERGGKRPEATGEGKIPGEEDLVERFRRGDERAFEILLQRSEALLRSRIRRRLPLSLRRRVSVLDVIQETRIAAFQGREGFQYRGEGSWLGWLAAIAENRVRTTVAFHAGAARRAANREVTRDARPETGELPGREASPSQNAIADELEALAREALESLSPARREILRLTRDEHLTIAEAASRMGRSTASARRLYGNALVQYREVLDFLRGA